MTRRRVVPSRGSSRDGFDFVIAGKCAPPERRGPAPNAAPPREGGWRQHKSHRTRPRKADHATVASTAAERPTRRALTTAMNRPKRATQSERRNSRRIVTPDPLNPARTSSRDDEWHIVAQLKASLYAPSPQQARHHHRRRPAASDLISAYVSARPPAPTHHHHVRATNFVSRKGRTLPLEEGNPGYGDGRLAVIV